MSYRAIKTSYRAIKSLCPLKGYRNNLCCQKQTPCPLGLLSKPFCLQKNCCTNGMNITVCGSDFYDPDEIENKYLQKSLLKQSK